MIFCRIKKAYSKNGPAKKPCASTGPSSQTGRGMTINHPVVAIVRRSGRGHGDAWSVQVGGYSKMTRRAGDRDSDGLRKSRRFLRMTTLTLHHFGFSVTTLHLGTRKSALALWQATHVRDRLLALHPGLNVTIVPMTTMGDRQLSGPLTASGGKALFTKELEQGLSEGRIDLAVHSMKDVVAQLPEGLTIGAILEREDPRDALVSALRVAGLDDLPPGARIGTASLRRSCQIRHGRPDLHIETLRGNVNSRLARLDAGEFSAIILAAAGLKRLGLAERISGYLPINVSLPAASQGAIGIECRQADAQTTALIAPLHHPDTALCVEAERAVTGALEGGCRLPIAAFATLEDDRLTLRALVGEPDGSRLLTETRRGPAAEAAAIAREVVAGLLSQGAGTIIERLLKEGV